MVRRILPCLLIGMLLGCDEPESERPDDPRSDSGEPIVTGDAGSAASDASAGPSDSGSGAGPLDAAVVAPGMDAAPPDAVPPSEAGGPAQDDAATPPDAAPAVDAARPDASWPRLESAQIGAPKRVAGGYGLAESPLWDKCGHRLLFPDVNANTIHQLAANGRITTFMSNTNHTNGMAFDRDGTLVLAQMGGGRGGRVVRRHHDGTLSVLADKDTMGGGLHTVDDVVIRSDGTLYFTDGDFPHGPYLGVTIFSALPVYFIKPGAGARTVVHGHAVTGPNGVELSPDEKTLYLSSYFGERIVKLDVAADGSLSRPSTFANGLSASDSFCLDSAGNVYAGMATGLSVLRPDGSRVKTIAIQSVDGTTNCGFGGEDGKTLYVTTWTDLWKIEGMPIPGLDWTINQDIPCE